MIISGRGEYVAFCMKKSIDLVNIRSYCKYGASVGSHARAVMIQAAKFFHQAWRNEPNLSSEGGLRATALTRSIEFC
jgi:hypothetical protein